MAALGQPTAEFPPFRIEPSFVGRVWGWRDLRPWYDEVAGAEPIGEVWLTGDQCRAATGPWAGQTLGALFARFHHALLGEADPGNGSPLLVKVIFAREKLSVQVHPDDAMARKYGQPHGKTECWYALAAEPGARVALGFKPDLTLDRVRSAIAAGTVEECLKIEPVAPGDVFLVDAGTVHAIWPGSVLLETQQYSDTTYRMYDYGRPRELHIERSLEAVRMKTRAGKVPARRLEDRTVLVDASYFCLERFPVNGTRLGAALRAVDETASRLVYLFAAAGAGRITGDGFEPVDLPARGMVAVPAAAAAFEIENLGGLDLIRIAPKTPAA